MKKIGLIGGMSFEGSLVYYRDINRLINRSMGGLSSANLLLDSLNFAEIVALQKAGRWDVAGETLARSAKRLEVGGADAILICAVTMHLVAEQVATAVDVPFIHIIDVVADDLKRAGKSKPLLIATRYTMEHGFYLERMSNLGIAVSIPDTVDREEIHRIIFEELGVGIVRDESRVKLQQIVMKARDAGADSVIFGCTEICLILDAQSVVLPSFDSTALHIQAAVEFALADR